MATAFMDPRCKLNFFLANSWSVGGEMSDSYQPLGEDLILTRVKPGQTSVSN